LTNLILLQPIRGLIWSLQTKFDDSKFCQTISPLPATHLFSIQNLNSQKFGYQPLLKCFLFDLSHSFFLTGHPKIGPPYMISRVDCKSRWIWAPHLPTITFYMVLHSTSTKSTTPVEIHCPSSAFSAMSSTPQQACCLQLNHIVFLWKDLHFWCKKRSRKVLFVVVDGGFFV
jgi:hypothetical protein